MRECEDPAEACRGYSYCDSEGRLSACECELAPDAGPEDAGVDSGPPDSGPDDAGLADAGPGDAGPPDAGVCTAPTSGFGPEEGDTFEPIILNGCGGAPFDLYTSPGGICDGTFTVVVIHAGWCGPCRREAAELQAMVADAYADRGVNVVSALLQNDSYSAPDATFCAEWASSYGLRSPVLLDPMQRTGVYFPGGLMPAFVIVDRDGVIRRRRYGYSEGPREILDALRVLVGS